jgi:hypothetical protein
MRGFEIGTFMMPSMEGEHVKAPARTIEVPVGFIGVIDKNKTKTELCMDFMMFLSGKKGFQTYMDSIIGGGNAPNGISLVYDVTMPEEYAEIYEGLYPIGNVQKPPCQTLARGAPNEIQQSNREWHNYTVTYFKSGKTPADLDAWAAAHQNNIMNYMDDSLSSAGIARSDLNNPQNRPVGA